MHVPTCESSLLDIVSFDDALASSGGRGDYDAEKWLYVPVYRTDIFSELAEAIRSSASA